MILISLEGGISMPAVLDLLYRVDIWIAYTSTSNHTSPYKEDYIKMRTDKGSKGTIGISSKAVHSECHGHARHIL